MSLLATVKRAVASAPLRLPFRTTVSAVMSLSPAKRAVCIGCGSSRHEGAVFGWTKPGLLWLARLPVIRVCVKLAIWPLRLAPWRCVLLSVWLSGVLISSLWWSI